MDNFSKENQKTDKSCPKGTVNHRMPMQTVVRLTESNIVYRKNRPVTSDARRNPGHSGTTRQIDNGHKNKTIKVSIIMS